MRVLIADNHGLYRVGLRTLLAWMGLSVELREAASFDQAAGILDADGPIDLALLDVDMPGLGTLEPLRAARVRHGATRFAILSDSAQRHEVLAALATGVQGFICKEQSEEEIEAAVRDILAGRIYVPPFLNEVHIGLDFSAKNMTKARLAEKADLGALTRRQMEVLHCLALGRSNKEIARTLTIAEPTVKIHVAALMRALGVRNRTEAAVLARDLI